MLFVKFIRWLYKTLNGTQWPWQIALGLAIGFAFGLPPFGLVTLVGLVLALLVNVHFGSALFGLAVGMATGVFVRPSIGRSLGEWVIEAGPHSFFKYMAVSDGWALFRLHESEVTGSLVLGLLLILPIFFGIKIFVAWFRSRFFDKLSNSRIFKAMSSTVLFRFLRWVFLG